MTAVDKRLFYLMLSPSLGQDFAVEAGFSPPSDEVQEKETIDVIARWSVLTTAGLLEDIIETSDWMCDFQDIKDEDARDDTHRAFISYGVGLVNKLLDSNKVMLVMMLDEDIDDE